MKPSTTFTVLSHEPERGISLSSVGKKANRPKGSAKPRAKPPMPNAGPRILPCEAASTNSVPIIGPVQENDTNTKVKAMKNMEMKPVVDSAFESMALLHFEGSSMLNAPKNDTANTTSSKKKNTLNIALVASSLRVLAPKIMVMAMPNTK